MLDPGVIATLSRRHVGKFTSVGVIRPHFLAPSLQREGRIGDHAIKLGQGVAAVKCRLPEGISSHDAKVFYTVKVQVDAGDARCGQVPLLAVELSSEEPHVPTGITDVIQPL